MRWSCLLVVRSLPSTRSKLVPRRRGGGMDSTWQESLSFWGVCSTCACMPCPIFTLSDRESDVKQTLKILSLLKVGRFSFFPFLMYLRVFDLSRRFPT